jgi:CRP-like cAMP-binding protein
MAARFAGPSTAPWGEDIPTRRFPAGEVIFREGDDHRDEAFVVHAGKVEILKKSGGEECRVRVLGKGELLGELALFRGTPHSASAVALEPVTLLVIPARRLEDMVRERPALAVALIRQLANRLREAEEQAFASRPR